MIRLRKASLGDYDAIWQIHASDINNWVDEAGEVDLARFSKLTMAERWQQGGPWMSPETCAIHLNSLLLAGQLPLVASKGGRVLGELELFIGEDAAAGGKNANISVFYTHRIARGLGLGSALLTEARRRAKVLGCQTMTVFNPSPKAELLYRRFGLDQVLEQQVLTLTCKPFSRMPKGVSVQVVDWPAFEVVAPLPLWIGYQQSSCQCWQQVRWGLAPGLYALPLKPITHEMTLFLKKGIGTAYLAFRPIGNGEQAQVYLWTEAPDDSWMIAASSIGRKLRFRELVLLCERQTAGRLQQVLGGHLGAPQKRLLGLV